VPSWNLLLSDAALQQRSALSIASSPESAIDLTTASAEGEK
jgi:hypothetical protein